ncbi:RIIa domain-containing protein 1 [Phasianus colchicus]|uniref:RIIa domain-containing protein 1 n=1 Tax=Phasianus colchicus TaxID=9054 RepID=UPI00129E0444|nr:RIIa domain-containing protein 1 [Phasianus colchicus]
MAAPGPEAPGAERGPSLRPSVERYLRERPEVVMLLRGLLREVMLRRPHNILEFAAGYFTDPELPRRIWDQLETPQRPQ